MTAPANLLVATGAARQHADADEYDAFVARHTSNHLYRNRCNCFRQQFVDRYPDLDEWFAEPLDVRIGRGYRAAPHTYTDATNARARGYLLYLGLTLSLIHI